MGKHIIVSYLDSSKSERCAVEFSKMFLARYKGRNLNLKSNYSEIFELEMNQSNCFAKKQAANNDQNQLIFTHLCH